MKTQIGTVTLLQDRVYEDVSVPAGTYPVYRDDDSVYWEMQGYPSSVVGGFERVGEGMFMLSPQHDVIVSPNPIEYQSVTFEVAEFQYFITSDPLCVRGSAQRLQFNISSEAVL